MSDYISREAAIACLYSTMESYYIKRNIMDLPAADVRPVVRGKWELIERRIISKVQIWKCSNCGNFLEVRETTFNAGRGDCNYCPHCGADMREETE